MPNTPPGTPIIAGVAKPGQFPQWGVKQVSGKAGYGTSKADYSVEKAPNSAQQTALFKNGYDVWFGTQIAANNFVDSQVNNAKNPVVKASNAAASGLGSVLGFLSGLTSVNLWIRVVKVLAGGALVIVGIAHMTGVDKGIVGAAVKAAPLL